ncbi:hypothetical protein [Bifidobacterium gallicum]|uniref:Sugar ABC transporter periplasmic protein n=1 Tax=Bifidobacterium gallicum DSM 20093 = LMG 11596 TaxID=561180 RepID=D1NT43_9BIFI|nr:hypothetical protein [Bifidobacterium gallicum]EFA23845.1 hypothetical protein BIFGAL_02954 [Bifidobacterium gallicum DSM 20093 = LMG 11596]KFI59165.1 sugar ABC transporter periplasmic protein [Bifidobacterium gallicum DSM 20093 = LMG 11596]
MKAHRNKRNARNKRNSHGLVAALAALSLTVAGAMMLASCSPSGHAVGDTQSVKASPTHDQIQGSTVTVGFIGSAQGGADELVLDACKRADINAAYVSMEGKSGADLVKAQVAGIDDIVHRHMNIVMISALDMAGDDAHELTQALENARNAGVAVVLLNPVDEPQDSNLYAAALRINDRMMDAQPIGDVLMTIAKDDPHEKDITVSTLQ